MENRTVKFLVSDNTILFLLFLLGIGSFILSYAGMYSVALDSGFGWLSFLWPVVTETAVVILSLTLLNIKLNGLTNRWIWWAIIGCTVLSSGLNVWHSPDKQLMTMLVWALPPIFLFVSFKVWVWKVEQDVKRFSFVKSIGELENELSKGQNELKTLSQQIEQSKLVLDNQPELTDKDKNKIKLANFLSQNPHATQEAMMEYVGVKSRPTIKTYLDEMNYIKNGQGWERVTE